MGTVLHEHLASTNSQRTDVNILLLGETGVGKSTFINSFANYMEYSTLKKALDSKLLCLIPTKFTIPDENFVDRFIEIGSDVNEDIEIGNSSTQGARGYVFQVGDRTVRLIDTPGIGDARGVDQDKTNFENVLQYISQFEELHAVCFLLKPNVSVINAYFQFCIVHLLSRLERSAASNIVFIYTNSRSTFYRPGETLPVLRKILDEIKQTPPHVTVPCSKENMFCMDNEPFKFLVALKHGIKFGSREKNDFGTSWETSYATCRELLAYICGENNRMRPHKIRNTLSVNEARRNIIDLSKPMADISDLIHDNLVVLNRHQQAILQENLSKTELQKRLFVPAIEMIHTRLDKPVTICASRECSEIYTCEGLNKFHYKQRCHNPCHLRNVPQEIIGSPELRHCAAIGAAGICKLCGCDFSAHMHIYYETKVHHVKREDETVKTKLNSAQDMVAAKRDLILKLTASSNEYESEKREISKTMAKFAHFLQENSIATYHDAYIDYIDYLIERGYVFQVGDRTVRLIDTPGIGDARGVDQDKTNFENVLQYISQFEELHAVCFLLKPNVSVINAYFQFCIVHLLSRLERSAASNIVFIYTNSRSTFYRPGETLPVLRKILDEIKQTPPHVTVPCSKENMFCMDNEPFKFLVALKHGIKFGSREKNDFGTSWETSYATCRELLAYICGENNRMRPHKIRNTLSVNEARRNIIDLSKPMADISDLIHDNLVVLNRHQQAILQENLSKTELQKRLFVPAIEMIHTRLDKPVTICASRECSEIYTCEGLNKFRYKQRCHNPCHLRNVPQEIIGSPELRHCAAIGAAGICKLCGCDFSAHMHIYYETKVHHVKREDETVKTKLNSAQDMVAAKRDLILKLTASSNEYESEKREISKTMAKFAHFLQENSIATYHDAYIDYIDYLIERENLLGYNKNVDTMMHYRELKKSYVYEKKALDDALEQSKKYNSDAVIISPEDILTAIKTLYKLTHTGKKIKELHESQQFLRGGEYSAMEYRHPNSVDVSESSDDSDNCDVLKILLQEKNLEAMRMKLNNMELPGRDACERKQKIWNVLKSCYKEPQEDAADPIPKQKQRGNPTGANKKQAAGKNPVHGKNVPRGGSAPWNKRNYDHDGRNQNQNNENPSGRYQNFNANPNQNPFPNQFPNGPNSYQNYPQPYPNLNQNYPQPYPNTNQNYPNSNQNYPNSNQNYPNSNQNYPNSYQNPFTPFSSNPYQFPNGPNQYQNPQNFPSNYQHNQYQRHTPNNQGYQGKPRSTVFKKKTAGKKQRKTEDDSDDSDPDFVLVKTEDVPKPVDVKMAVMEAVLDKFRKELQLKKMGY